MPKYQIRDKDFGLSLYEAASPREALYAFLADQVKGEVRSQIEVGEDGSASVPYRGETYTAVEMIE